MSALLLSNLNPVYAQSEKPLISICGDLAGWPPFHYFQRKGGEKTSEIVGYDVDVLKEILEPKGFELEFSMIPWKRCLFEVSKGVRYQIGLSSSFSKTRDLLYYLSVPYYEVTPHYYYSKRHFPNGLKIDRFTDLYNYKGCGLLGYNYAGFGVTNELIDTSANDFPQIIQMTHRGRCDFFLARYEIFSGFVRIGENFPLDPQLGHSKLPGNVTDPFHLLITRNHSISDQLKRLIDEGIQQMKDSGQLENLLNSYLEVP